MNLENLAGAEIVLWCNGCNAEQAIDQIEVQINGQWIAVDVGEQCLTRLKQAGRIDM